MVGRKPKEKEKLLCAACQKEKDKDSGFYNSRSKLYEKIGKVPICKSCLKKNIDYSNMDSVYTVLQQIDVKFDPLYWEQAVQRKTDTFSAYMTMANSLKQFNGTGWMDSILEQQQEKAIAAETQRDSVEQVSDEIIDKWELDIHPMNTTSLKGSTTNSFEIMEKKPLSILRDYSPIFAFVSKKN
nr:hypothetical protein [Bacillus subtilis]